MRHAFFRLFWANTQLSPGVSDGFPHESARIAPFPDDAGKQQRLSESHVTGCFRPAVGQLLADPQLVAVDPQTCQGMHGSSPRGSFGAESIVHLPLREQDIGKADFPCRLPAPQFGQ